MKIGNLKIIAFDLGYTLAYNRREDQYLTFLESESIIVAREKVERAYHRADKTFMRSYHGVLGNPPEFYMPWYIGLVNYYLNLKFDLIKQVKFILEKGENNSPFWLAFPWTTRVLETLRAQGYRLALLSNWDLSCRDVLQQIGVYGYFDHILVSSELKVSKPDARIFEHLLEVSNYNPDEILYVGDNYYDDVIGAAKAGIKTVLINRFGKLGIEEIQVPYIVENTLELFDLLDSDKLKVTNYP